MAEFTTVFLSSTARDLQPYREAVQAAINKMPGMHCIRMEGFGAVDAEPLEVCRRKVAESDLFVGLVGHYFGSSPEESPLSFTQFEYEEAKRGTKPRLIFLADDDFPLAPRLGREAEEAYQGQLAFREQVRRERTVVGFHDPDKLATQVVTSLQTHLEEARKSRGKAAPTVSASGPTGPAIEESVLAESYLGHLIGKIEHLTLQGIDPAVKDSGQDPRLKLSGVYTALRTLSFAQGGEGVGPGKAVAAGPETPDERRPLSALELLDREKRLVLLGDPGSGKSTFVHFVALCLAGESLGRADLNLATLNTQEGGEGDPDLDFTDSHPDGDGPEANVWKHGALLPVRFVLRDIAAKGHLPQPGTRVEAGTLWDFLRSELEACGHPDFFPYLRRALLAGRCLALFDGLDEVPEAQDRRHQILQAVESWSNSVPKCRVLVTSRTYAYQKQEWKLDGFAEATLAPFSQGQIGRFIGLWYEQMAALGRFGEEEARGRAELLRRAIFGSDRLMALAERPLLLTLTASLHAWRGGVLPERREELYRDAVELLLDTWERKRAQLDERGELSLHEPSLAEWLKIDRQEVRRVLEELAFEAHKAQPDLAGTADIAEASLAGKLLHLKRNPDAHTGQLVAYLRDRSGILIERGNGVFAFPHRTFQEYLAACHLTGGSDLEEIAGLGRADPGRWREVVLLAGAKSASGSKASVWYLAEALCGEEPGEAAALPADEWGALLAGQVVAESADLTRVSPANEKKLGRLRRWLVRLLATPTFPALERVEAGKALAVLGDPRFDPERWFLPNDPNLGFVEVPAGPFWMGSDAGDPHAAENEKPRHEVDLPGFWISRFPVTVAQFRAFVETSGYEQGYAESLRGGSNEPAAFVTWHEALAYCRWLGEALAGAALREARAGSFWAELGSGRLRAALPSEAEWEKAARGLEGRVYPWGQDFDPNRANCREAGLFAVSPVGAFPGGVSPFGCEEMSGNVWELRRNTNSAPLSPLPSDSRRASR